MGIKIKRTGHLVLKVKDPERSLRLFPEILALPPWRQLQPAGCFLFSPDLEPNHHVLASRQAPDGAPLPQPDYIGMEHVAYELASFADLQEAYRIFKANNVRLRHVVFH